MASDGNGVIEYTKFLAAALDPGAYLQEDVSWATFRIFDKHRDGQISTKELNKVLQSVDVHDITTSSMADVMAEVDQNNDGEIDFDEFMQTMRGSTK